MRSLVWIIIAVIIFGTAWRLFQGLQAPITEIPAEKVEPLIIGAVLPLSGDGAAYGVPIQRAGQLAVDEINAAGGVSGRTVIVIWEDGKCNAKVAEAAVNKLATVDKIGYILGGVCSSEVLSGAKIAESSRIVWISPAATSPDITEAGDYIFRTAPSDSLEGKIAAQYAHTVLKAQSAAILSENNEYVQELRKAFMEEFIRLGGEVKRSESYITGDANVRSQALRIKEAGPDVVYLLPQTPTAGLLFVKQLRDQKITAQLLTAETLMNKDIVKDNAALLEGLIGIKPYFDDASPNAQSFIAAYENRFDEPLAFPNVMANYYSQFYLLKAAIEAVGDDPTGVKDWLYSVSDWTHALGILNFDVNGDPLAHYRVLKVQDGAMAFLQIVAPAETATFLTP